MGWFYNTTPCTKEQFVYELLHQTDVIDYEVVGNALWCLINADCGAGKRRPLILLDLLHKPDGCWGHKPMDETMGPLIYNCPLRLLDAAGDPPNERAAEFRRRVRDWHATQPRPPLA